MAISIDLSDTAADRAFYNLQQSSDSVEEHNSLARERHRRPHEDQQQNWGERRRRPLEEETGKTEIKDLKWISLVLMATFILRSF